MAMTMTGNPDADRWLSTAERAKRTIERYRTAIGRLLNFVEREGWGTPESVKWDALIPVQNEYGQHVGYDPLDAGCLEDFLLWLANTHGATPEVLSSTKDCLAVFCDYLVADGKLDTNPVADMDPVRVSRQKDATRLFLPHECLPLLRAAASSNFPERDYAIVGFGLRLGPRPAEFCSFELSHDSKTGYLYGKTGQRPIPVPTDLQAAITQYLNHPLRRDFPRAPVFLDDDKPFTQARLLELVQDLARMAGIRQPRTVYWFRHSAGTLLAAQGVPIPALQALFGHATPETTQQYIHQLKSTSTDPRARLQAEALRRLFKGPRDAPRKPLQP